MDLSPILIQSHDDTSSGCSSIASWLDGHPSLPEEYEEAPSTQIKIIRDVKLSLPTRQSDEDEEENEETPRPTSYRHRQVVSVQLASPQPQKSVVDRQSDTSSKSSTNSITTPKRSRNPTKHMSDFKLADISAISRPFVERKEAFPKITDNLYLDLKEIERARGTIPICYKTRVMKYTALDHPHKDDFSAGQLALFPNENLEPVAFWHRMSIVLRNALDCQKREAPEATWNEKVHSPLLEVALEGNPLHVNYANVTSARITDTSVLPSTAAGQKVMDAKIVDFVMILDYLDQDAEKQVIESCRHQVTDSINHTSMTFIRYSPIAVSIETKRGAVEEYTANVQLALWVYAHFAKLKTFIPANRHHTIPHLPLVKVLGHQWFLQLAKPSGSRSEIVIYGDLLLGSTSSMLGVFQVVAAVRRLARWVGNEYATFLMKEVFA